MIVISNDGRLMTIFRNDGIFVFSVVGVAVSLLLPASDSGGAVLLSLVGGAAVLSLAAAETDVTGAASDSAGVAAVSLLSTFAAEMDSAGAAILSLATVLFILAATSCFFLATVVAVPDLLEGSNLFLLPGAVLVAVLVAPEVRELVAILFLMRTDARLGLASTSCAVLVAALVAPEVGELVVTTLFLMRADERLGLASTSCVPPLDAGDMVLQYL